MTQPASAPYLYVVRVEVDPQIEAGLLAWLDTGGHVREVVSQPGFLWAQRYKLAQDAHDGWRAYLMLYALESKAALDAYFANPIHEKFARERARFDAGLRTDRVWGAFDGAVAAR
jgi:quinol monooxygenase YgiN